jgi:hypothetical protein
MRLIKFENIVWNPDNIKQMYVYFDITAEGKIYLLINIDKNLHTLYKFEPEGAAEYDQATNTISTSRYRKKMIELADEIFKGLLNEICTPGLGYFELDNFVKEVMKKF